MTIVEVSLRFWRQVASGLLIVFCVFVLNLYGCSYIVPQSGPSTYSVISESNVIVVNLNPEIALKFKQEENDIKGKIKDFVTPAYSPSIGKGDILEVVIYESPPGVLLSSSPSVILQPEGISSLTVPPQMVDEQGYISIPFAGKLYVLGKKPEEVANEIQRRLSKKANRPQVVVRLVGVRSSAVTVFGHVKESKKVTLTYTTNTLLDVLASVGGVTSPINKTLVQISRGGRKVVLPLEEIIRNPELNINLKPGDIITVIYKTQSATILGATGRNMELEFEARGITLSQALGRAGGLRDDINHAKGLFVFRFEDKNILDRAGVKYKIQTKEGKVPVVYNIDISKAESVFILRDFEIKDGDIIYLSTAPAVQLSKFLGMISDIIQPVFMIDVLSR